MAGEKLPKAFYDRDTLWRMAHRVLKDPMRWPDIARHNPGVLKDSFFIFPGMRVDVPGELVKEHLPTARIADVLNQVWHRGEADADWRRAYRDLILFDRDRLRTDSRAEIRVRFKNDDLLIVPENSLVQIRTEPGKEEVQLLKGEAILKAARIRLTTPSAKVVPQDGPALYRAKVAEDGSTVLQVERGRAELTSLDTGQSIVLSAGHADIVRKGSGPEEAIAIPKQHAFALSRRIGEPRTLLAKAETLEKKAAPARPEHRGEPSVPDLEQAVLETADVKLDPIHSDPKWKGYRLQLASDSDFRSLEREYVRALVSGRKAIDVQEKYELPDGTYHRRIAYRDAGSRESPFYKLPDLVLNTDSPSLALATPEEGAETRQAFIIVRGKTDPGMIVTVNERPVEVQPDGSFYWGVVLSKAGANKISIVAKDLRENRSLLERTVVYLSR